MSIKEGFISSFLVLGFVIFMSGFLTGMLAVAFISIKEDIAVLGLMLFILGFITGTTTIALTLIILRLSELTKKSLS